MPDPIALSSDAELRAVVERALSANYEIDREIGRVGAGEAQVRGDQTARYEPGDELCCPAHVTESTLGWDKATTRPEDLFGNSNRRA